MQFKKTFAGVLNTESKTQHYLPASLKSGDFLRCIRICVLQLQDQGNSSDDSTKTELKTGQTKLTRRWSAGGKRWRNTGEWSEWKNSGNKMKANAGDPVQVGRKKKQERNRTTETKIPRKHSQILTNDRTVTVCTLYVRYRRDFTRLLSDYRSRMTVKPVTTVQGSVSAFLSINTGYFITTPQWQQTEDIFWILGQFQAVFYATITRILSQNSIFKSHQVFFVPHPDQDISAAPRFCRNVFYFANW